MDFTDGSSHSGHALLDFALERDWGLRQREQADECRRMLEVFRSRRRPAGKLRFVRYN